MEKQSKKKRKVKVNIKITELKPVPPDKVGRVIISDPNIQPHEEATVYFLAKLGFDITTITPSGVPKSKNPDLLMMGTFWEMKAPQENTFATLERKFRKAVKQSDGKAVFDLRQVSGTDQNAVEVEKNIMKLFKTTRGMRRIIIIRKSGQALDIMK